jgi:hypothetical protein
MLRAHPLCTAAVGAIGLWLIGPSESARAFTVLPPYVASVFCTPPVTGPPSNTSCSGSVSAFGVTYTDMAKASPGSQFAGASASSNGPGVEGLASLTYYVQAVLPPGVPPGPVALELFSDAEVSGQAAAATISVSTEPLARACAGASCNPGDSSGWTIRKFTVGSFTGAPLQIELSAGAIANTGSSFAFVDPYIVVDPSSPNASLYTLQFSPGIGNQPLPGMVPEPESWALMIAGFSMLGVAIRRDRERSRAC